MSLRHYAMLLVYSLGLIAGQILFKLSASAYSNQTGRELHQKAWSVLTSFPFLLGIAIYFMLSLFWVRLLTEVPISKAYPFVALNFILVAIAGVALFGERVSPLNAAGLLMIAGGIVLATR